MQSGWNGLMDKLHAHLALAYDHVEHPVGQAAEEGDGAADKVHAVVSLLLRRLSARPGQVPLDVKRDHGLVFGLWLARDRKSFFQLIKKVVSCVDCINDVFVYSSIRKMIWYILELA